MANTELVPVGAYGAIMTVEQAVGRRQMIVEFTSKVMRAETDYGVIPGTQKPTLLKPGAEKLCTLFGLVPHFEIVREIEDWTGERAGGEPLFYYLYRCSLYRNGEMIAEGDGSANSREKKHRYRNAERKCPDCGKETIRKSKDGDGWYCWRKIGGCGQIFGGGCDAIVNQNVGLIANPDVFDLVNTLQKMAQKRALIAATLIGVNASEFYTQDMEDFHDGTPPAPHPVQATVHEDPPPPDHDDVREAAEREAQERAAAKSGAELKAQRDAENRDTMDKFTVLASELGFRYADNKKSVGALAAVLLQKDKPSFADMRAGLELGYEAWKAAIQKAHAQLDVNPVAPPAEEPVLSGIDAPAPSDTDAKATIGAMSR